MICVFVLAADIIPSSKLEILPVLMGLFGGLALFLLGMDRMAEALKLIAGDGLRKLLSRLTTNRFTGVAAGAVVTAIIQSSSVTTVLVVSFISAGLMSLSQSIGIIMGANIGTTMTAQIIAFKVTEYALILVALGFLLSFFLKAQRIRNLGEMLLGLGLVFFGMQLMSNGTKPLQNYAPFIEFMKNLDSPLLGVAFGAVFTALVQSSSATTGIVIVLASQGLLPLNAAIALIFGANIGTCFTAWLAALGKPIEAKRAVAVHILFNVAGVVLWFFFIPQLAQWVRAISPQAPDLQGVARLAAETPRQIANAHTIFNLTNTLVFIWWAGPIGKLVVRMLPSPARHKKKPENARNKYLDPALLETPVLALDSTRLELARMGKKVEISTQKSLEILLSGGMEELRELCQMDDTIDQLHREVLEYLATLSRQNLNEEQSTAVTRYLAIANYLESIGDMVETNMVEVGKQRLKAGFIVSNVTRRVLSDYHALVTQQVAQAVKAMSDNDAVLAKQVIDAKDDLSRLAREAEKHLTRRLSSNEPDRIIAFRLESEIIENLKRVYYFSKRIAKVVLDANRDEKQSV